jgi:hypothetical protein
MQISGAIGDHAANEFTVQRLRIICLVSKLKLSEYTAQPINAKFYYEVLKQRRWNPPTKNGVYQSLNEEELARLCNAMENRT